MEAVYRFIMRKYGPTFAVRAAQFTSIVTPDPAYLLRTESGETRKYLLYVAV
jgi:hypothetical protein